MCKRGIPLKLRDYIGEYIKIYTNNSDWFICEPLKEEDGNKTSEQSRIMIIVISSENSSYTLGEMQIEHANIKRIESLDTNIQEGLRLTLNYSPDIQNTYSSTDAATLPDKIVIVKRNKMK